MSISTNSTNAGGLANASAKIEPITVEMTIEVVRSRSADDAVK